MVQDINSLEYNRVLFIPEKCTVPVGYTREIDVYMSEAVNNKNKKKINIRILKNSNERKSYHGSLPEKERGPK